MQSTPESDEKKTGNSFKLMLMAIVAALIGVLQAIVRKPFKR